MSRILPLILSVLLFGSNAWAQSVEDLVSGPVEGLTYVPPAGKFALSVSAMSVHSDSRYDYRGEIVPYDTLWHGYADPELAITVVSVSGEFALSNKLGLGISIPMVLKQEMEMNPDPGFGAFIRDKSGETGLGDLSINSWYFLARKPRYQAMILGGLTLASGSSPDEISSSNVSSTGSGHSSIRFGGAADIMVIPDALVSLAGVYTINNQASFSSDGTSRDEKAGNSIQVIGRAAYRVTPQIAIGTDIVSFSQGKRTVNEETIDNSEISFLQLVPVIGYQLSTGSNRVNVSGGYPTYLSGKNYEKFNGLMVGVSLLF